VLHVVLQFIPSIVAIGSRFAPRLLPIGIRFGSRYGMRRVLGQKTFILRLSKYNRRLVEGTASGVASSSLLSLVPNTKNTYKKVQQFKPMAYGYRRYGYGAHNRSYARSRYGRPYRTYRRYPRRRFF